MSKNKFHSFPFIFTLKKIKITPTNESMKVKNAFMSRGPHSLRK